MAIWHTTTDTKYALCALYSTSIWSDSVRTTPAHVWQAAGGGSFGVRCALARFRSKQRVVQNEWLRQARRTGVAQGRPRRLYEAEESTGGPTDTAALGLHDTTREGYRASCDSPTTEPHRGFFPREERETSPSCKNSLIHSKQRKHTTPVCIDTRQSNVSGLRQTLNVPAWVARHE